MNIIWLTPEVPYPPIGGRNGVYNRIVQLSQNNNIYLFSIAYNHEEKINKEEMLKYCDEVRFYDRSENKIATLAKSIIYPFSVASRYRKDIRSDIEETILKKGINLVIVDFPNMAKNIVTLAKKYTDVVFTINEHNVEYIRMRDMRKVASIPFYKRIAYFFESLRLEVYERKIYKSNIFKGITFFSIADCEFFQKNIDCGHAQLKTIPLGANDYGKQPLHLNNRTLLFVGRLDHIAIPNVEAMVWFVGKVWPKIKESVSDARLIIAGANPANEINALQREDIVVIPNFSKMEDVYNMTDCVILPLLSGGGVKGKLLEAIAFRKHVVTTSHGIEGTVFKDQEHVFLAESAENFAEACVKVLLCPEKYIDMEANAYSLFRQIYGWNSIGKQYEEFISSLNLTSLI